MITWTPSLSVGIDEIDAQHQELFRRAAQFVSSLEDRSRRDVGSLLAYLRLYAVTHFGTEEERMREAGYPGYAAHKAEHDGFIRELIKMSDEHERRGGPGLQPLRVATFLGDWLERHVSSTDQALARHLLTRH